jgi:arylsulfatase A-like enzyme/ketosteroid isomerase-like protein
MTDDKAIGPNARAANMNRWLLLAIAAGVIGCPVLVAGSETAKRPNILFAFADDWGRCAGAYARIDGNGTMNDAIQTPTFDRVAREGVLFRHAFVSAPSCTPCRSALLTGQHFWRTGRGAILRGAVWEASHQAFPFLLRDSGYHIGETYKVWSPGTPVDAPFGAGQYAYERAGGQFNQFSEQVTRMVAEGMPVDAAKQVLYKQVRANFDAFLAARDATRPFCYWFGPTNVHRKWIKGSGKAFWGIDPDALQGKLPPFLPDVPVVREDVSDYFGEVQAFDTALGLLLERLAELGELDNTLVVVSGDHGPPGFPHGKCNLYDFGSSVALAIRWGGANGGRVVDDLVSLTDLAPTFLELANAPVPNQMTGRSLVEILRSKKSGLVDPNRSAVFLGRERHVDSARADFMPYPQRAIRTNEFLYIINFRPDRWPLGDPYRLDSDNPPSSNELTEDTRCTLADEDAGPAKAWLVGMRDDPHWQSHFNWVYGKRPREELYDLKTDPHQTRNVAADLAYEPTRARLEQQLLGELKRTGDPRLLDEGRFFETPPMSGPALEGRPAARASAVADVPAQLRQILTAQAQAWNRGDLVAFMDDYWKSEQLTFSSGGQVHRGWQATLDRYREQYPTRERMGQLSFAELEFTALSADAYLVLGRWNVARPAGDLTGNFTVIFRRLDGRWVIVHDHTSRDVPPQ